MLVVREGRSGTAFSVELDRHVLLGDEMWRVESFDQERLLLKCPLPVLTGAQLEQQGRLQGELMLRFLDPIERNLRDEDEKDQLDLDLALVADLRSRQMKELQTRIASGWAGPLRSVEVQAGRPSRMPNSNLELRYLPSGPEPEEVPVALVQGSWDGCFASVAPADATGLFCDGEHVYFALSSQQATLKADLCGRVQGNTGHPDVAAFDTQFRLAVVERNAVFECGLTSTTVSTWGNKITLTRYHVGSGRLYELTQNQLHVMVPVPVADHSGHKLQRIRIDDLDLHGLVPEKFCVSDDGRLFVLEKTPKGACSPHRESHRRLARVTFSGRAPAVATSVLVPLDQAQIAAMTWRPPHLVLVGVGGEVCVVDHDLCSVRAGYLSLRLPGSVLSVDFVGDRMQILTTRPGGKAYVMRQDPSMDLEWLQANPPRSLEPANM
jgi:hypothetical protein